MNKSILYSAITAALAINIAACGSSGSDVAGIGGSGITPTGGVISSGTITGFGSIFVNGVEYETSSSTFSVDDDPGTESDLAVGMVVTVNGTINADGVTGTADSVSYDDQLQGPITVAEVSDIDADGITRTITVLGTTVLLDINSTRFDISGTSPANFDFNNVNVGDNVEISGFFDSSGVLKATRVERKQQNFVPDSSIVELKGAIADLNGTDFTVNGVNVNASGATLDDLPGGLVSGTLVEVKGTCADTSCDPINATRVEGQTGDFDEDDQAEIEGIITRYASDSDFDVNGFPVDASSATLEPATLKLALDKEVEVEGAVDNGVLKATKVKDEGGDVIIAATVTDVDSAAGSFELTPVSGQPSITVKIDTSTQIEDDIGDFNSAALLENLNLDTDFLVVKGYEDNGTGAVIASELKRESSSDDIILQGIMESFTPGSEVTVLGVQFVVQLPETEFEDKNDSPLTEAEFDTNTTDGVTLVKVKDKNDGRDAADGVADEIEIEN